MMAFDVELVATGQQLTISLEGSTRAWLVDGQQCWSLDLPPKRTSMARAVGMAWVGDQGTSGTGAGKGNSNLASSLVTDAL
ncbi:MAG: hypothetical protein K2X55_28095 [Burkholderiaceae bacterium]|nr:hypothetical protein [Burkholderiaceae bacterium]